MPAGSTLFRQALWLALPMMLGGCGGGSGGGSTAPAPTPPPAAPADPFGLTERKPLAMVSLPVAGGSPGSYALEARFPLLSFDAALFVTAVPGEDRLMVLEQGGRVRVVASDPAAASAPVVLDISGRVTFGGEEGLLGLALDPDFVSNRYVYLHYSAGGPRRSVIARMRWDAATDLIDPASEKILLEIEQPYSNHNGGHLAFGPDDLLYIGMGDGGSAGDPGNNAQDPANLLGSMLRIDVHPDDPADPYDIPLGNPAFSQPGARPETYAIGLRNPFRFSFDRQTGALWLGDVGQNEREEINLIEAGANYGWRVFEGTRTYDDSANTLPPSAFTPPVFEYDHSEGVSVIGGYVYRGNALPGLRGRYLYSDFGSGTVWALAWDGTQVTDNRVLATASGPSSFGEDVDGELLVVTRFQGIYRLVSAGGGGGGAIPERLSETGLFEDLATLRPASGLVEYELNHPFWSDGTVKRRWFGVPDGARIDFDATGPWALPVGSITVKHFEIALTDGDPASLRRLETRVFVHGDDGWQGFTYRWNGAQTDATLLSGRESETLTITQAGGGSREQVYSYPSPADCLSCHSEAEGRALGLRTRQLNRDFDYGGVIDNQLRSLDNVGYFDGAFGTAADYDAYAPPDADASDLDGAARAYLAVNCAQCHQPAGTAPVTLDLRYDTPLSATNAVDALPAAGELGIVDARIIAPGERTRSVLWERLRRLDGDRMPPVGSHRVDAEGVELIGRWIDAL